MGARNVILMSHLGRPDGLCVPSMSLRPIATELQHLLQRPIRFLDNCVGDAVSAAISSAQPGEIFLLENLRFHLEEEGAVKMADGTKKTASPEAVAAFRASLSALGDVFVNDAFGTMHRAHSSIVGINLCKVAGLLVAKELEFFGHILDAPEGIDCAVMGGSKVSDKILLIENMLARVKKMVIGGGMAFTFLKAVHGMQIGKSLFDEAGSALVPRIMEEARKRGVQILLPVDFRTADKFAGDAKVEVRAVEQGIPCDCMVWGV